MFNEVRQDVRDFEERRAIAPLSNLKDAPIYVELGEEDIICRPAFKHWHDLWCEEVEAKCSINMVEGGHARTEGAPSRILNYLFTSLGADPINPANSNFLDEATMRRFDQQEFIDMAAQEYKSLEKNRDTTIDFQFTQMLRWGWVYYPNICKTKACKFSFVIHGCGGTAASFLEEWGSVAKDNETILVMPQGTNCWNSFDPLRGTGTNTKEGFTEIFFGKIIDRILEERNEKYDYDTVEEEESGVYDWSEEGRTSTEYTGPDADLYKTTECYTWFDVDKSRQQSCYNDNGLLDKFEAMVFTAMEALDNAKFLVASMSMTIGIAVTAQL